MAGRLRDAVRLIDEALLHLRSGHDAAIAAADGRSTLSARWKRRITAVWPRCSKSSTEPNAARRELHRRCARIGDNVIDIAEQVVHDVVKQI